MTSNEAIVANPDSDGPETNKIETDIVETNKPEADRVETNKAEADSVEQTAELVPEAKYNPAQQKVFDQLKSAEKPEFDPQLRVELRHEIETQLEKVLADAGFDSEKSLTVTKRDLGLVHGCNAKYLAEKAADFEWSIASARGSVAHKAIELSITYRSNPTPLDLVDAAMGRLEADETSLGEFLYSLDEAERADLAGRACDFVSTFAETFPPLERSWRPVAESKAAAYLCDGALRLRGRTDLSLGHARGQRAGKVIIDLKTGAPNSSHAEDLRFYALLETLKIGVPPRLVADYYLESGTPRALPINEDTLRSAALRLIDGVIKIVALKEITIDDADRLAGPHCRWCPINKTCKTGLAHIEALENSDY